MGIAHTRHVAGLLVVALGAVGPAITTVSAASPANERVSVATGGTQGDGPSQPSAISADGRYVAFASFAGNLVAGDNNIEWDVFVRDRQTGTTTRVSVASDGSEVDGTSSTPSISADGRYVAFASRATTLVAGDTNGEWDVFVRDRQTSTTTRVSVASGGGEGNNGSMMPAISADGRYVAFSSRATNLVAGDTNSRQDVFVHDRQTGTTTRVSVASDGTEGDGDSDRPSISADGRLVAFESSARDLVAGDSNGRGDVFVRDWQTGTTTRVSVASDGTGGDGSSGRPAISADGRYVAFQSSAGNLVGADTNGEQDVFVHDRQIGATTRVSVPSCAGEANSDSGDPSISADGRYVTFESRADNLVAGDWYAWDVFLRDRRTGTTTRVSAASDGGQANGHARLGSISADGRYVAFSSFGVNLVDGDTNGTADVFVHERSRAPAPVRDGYRLVGADGGVFTFGCVNFAGSAGDLRLTSPVVGVAATSSGEGYWLVAADGGVFAFGDARFHGSTGALRLTSPVVGMAATPTGQGYWLVAADGGVFAFGDARFYGSTGGLRLASPVVGMAATPTGRGYWLVAADGGVFAFGDARFYGSTGGLRLASPVVSIATTPTGRGYWLVAADGGVFAFGNAGFHGSTGGLRLASPVVGITATRFGKGYRMVAADGGVFAFGDARFYGSAAALGLTSPIVGLG